MGYLCMAYGLSYRRAWPLPYLSLANLVVIHVYHLRLSYTPWERLGDIAGTPFVIAGTRVTMVGPCIDS